jgi:hypothetical protein
MGTLLVNEYVTCNAAPKCTPVLWSETDGVVSCVQSIGSSLLNNHFETPMHDCADQEIEEY